MKKHLVLASDFSDLELFLERIQWFNALQFNARCHLFIATFGETVGIKFAERFDRYGLWFFLSELKEKERPPFFELVMSLTKDAPNGQNGQNTEGVNSTK